MYFAALLNSQARTEIQRILPLTLRILTDRVSWCSVVNEGVVVDGNIITSKGPATSLAFALRLVSALYSTEKADEVAAPMGFSK